MQMGQPNAPRFSFFFSRISFYYSPSFKVVPFKGFSNYACPFAFLADRLETARTPELAASNFKMCWDSRQSATARHDTDVSADVIDERCRTLILAGRLTSFRTFRT